MVFKRAGVPTGKSQLCDAQGPHAWVFTWLPEKKKKKKKKKKISHPEHDLSGTFLAATWALTRVVQGFSDSTTAAHISPSPNRTYSSLTTLPLLLLLLGRRSAVVVVMILKGSHWHVWWERCLASFIEMCAKRGRVISFFIFFYFFFFPSRGQEPKTKTKKRRRVSQGSRL